MMIKNDIQDNCSFTGKEHDEEKEGSRGPFASERGNGPRSGLPNGSTYLYTYFGARYMDHELMTTWLSVDPMADKDPNISPYNYCMWTPIKLVDPDGNDTVKIHLDKGRFEHITSKRDHCIQFYRGMKIIEDETMTISRETCRITQLEPQHLPYGQDGDILIGCTQYLEFSHTASGVAVFRKIANLGAERDLASKEWDYYELDTRGELSSSGLTNKMLHPADRYQYFSKMHHFHPFNEDESFYPSHSDQNLARKHPSSKCFLYSQGKSMEFGHLVPTDEGKYINMKKYAEAWRKFAN